MTDEEPPFKELLDAIADTVASNKLVDALRRKFQAQSFFEFFNRLWGTGMLLFVIGFLGLGVIMVVEESALSVSLVDLGNVLYIVLIALIGWFLMSVVRVVNVGETPMYGDEPTILSESLKIGSGLLILALVVYEFMWKGNPAIDFIVVSFLGAVVTGIWLLGLSWLFGGLSGLVRVHRSRETEPSETATNAEKNTDAEADTEPAVE